MNIFRSQEIVRTFSVGTYFKRRKSKFDAFNAYIYKNNKEKKFCSSFK